MKRKVYLSLFFILLVAYGYSQNKTPSMESISVNPTTDFDITGDGTSGNWDVAKWVDIKQRAHLDLAMETKVKTLYSKTGIYFLFYNKDPKLDASLTTDGAHLWTEDVVEVFLWPDTTKEIYFEYELSPLNYELSLLLMNIGGKSHRWEAWYLEDNRRVQHKTAIQGGVKESGASIESWTAEFFIPYFLLAPMGQVPPTKGTEWKVNFNRMDYLDKKEIYWSWQDLPGSFHEIKKFGTMLFK